MLGAIESEGFLQVISRIEVNGFFKLTRSVADAGAGANKRVTERILMATLPRCFFSLGIFRADSIY
jgi:hypothetical protein